MILLKAHFCWRKWRRATAPTAEIIIAIREAGRTPVQRNTFYEPINVLADGHQQTPSEAEPPSGKSKVLEENPATA